MTRPFPWETMGECESAEWCSAKINMMGSSRGFGTRITGRDKEGSNMCTIVLEGSMYGKPLRIYGEAIGDSADLAMCKALRLFDPFQG